MQNSYYHRCLRVSAVVFALLLVFESGLVHESTATLSVGTHQYLANAIGMSASVEPTELNQLTAELTVQKRALEAREAALREREIAVNLANDSSSNQRTTYVLASILFILIVLILLNYILDYRRDRGRSRVDTLQPV
jgi:hypothetical protein